MEAEDFMKSITGLIAICIFMLSITGCGPEKKATETVYSGQKSVNDFEDVLEQNPNGVLANRNGKEMRTQIISFQFVEGNNVYFCTGSEKPLYQQLIKFPYVSYCTYPDDFEPVLSLNGKVVFTDDIALKERVFNGTGYASQFIKYHYQTVDNPNLKLFYIDVDEIETYDSSGVNVYKTR
jgi:uncharacterized pyridoxamine 5'-phosphate oxidase family protein